MKETPMGETKSGDAIHQAPKRSGDGETSLLRRPLVSVIITNYNYECFLVDCLRSIASQTYTETEVFIIDDLSSDNSLATVRKFIAQTDVANDWQLIALEQNGGQMNAFIEGFERSKGTFVVFVDADDILFPDFIETHVRAHLNPRFVAGMSCSNEVIIDKDNRVIASSIEKWHWPEKPDHRLAPNIPVLATQVPDWIESWRLKDNVVMTQADEALLFIEPDDNQSKIWIWSTTSAVMFRRSVLEIGFSDEVRNIRICADYFLFHFCHLTGGSLILQAPHGAYRRHGKNNFASNMTIGRGSKAGTTGNGPTFEQLNKRVEAAFLEKYDMMVELIGEPRLMQILATLIPLRHIFKALFRVGKGRPSQKLQFLVMFAIRYGRRKAKALSRKLHFA